MKYLVHTCPPKEIVKKIEDYRAKFDSAQIKNPSNAYHTTLMVARFDTANEDAIITDLESICQPPFKVSASNLEFFDENTLVLRLQSPELKQLHMRVIESLKRYIDWTNTKLYTGEAEREKVCKEYGSQFYAQFYNPHITIAEANSDAFKKEQHNYSFFAGDVFDAEKFYLSKKDKKWEIVQEFKLA